MARTPNITHPQHKKILIKQGNKQAPSLQQALTFHQKGQLAQAQAIYLEILQSQPKHFDALHLLGVIAFQTKNYQHAIELINEAIAIYPNNAAFYYNRGNALKELKQFDAAMTSFDQAIRLKPDYAEAYSNRGNALKELKQFDAAVASYDQAIRLKPDYAEAYSNRGVALQELKQFDAAVASYDQAIRLKPDYAEVYSNRGVALKELKQFDAAVASFGQAIRLKPDYAEAYYNRGVALQELKQLDAALVSYDQAIRLKPDYAEAYSNRGNALKELKQFDAAVASFDQAIRLKPDYAEAYLNKSLALLLNSDLEKGWQLYEWRWETEDVSKYKRNFSQPLWLGVEALKDKTILLHSEQGLGDTLQFCRYAKLVAALGAHVLMEVSKPLMHLLQGLEGISGLVEKGTTLPAFDYHCPLLSLPLAFKTSLDNIPGNQAYLSSDRIKVADWEHKLGVKTKPRVGIAWSGNTAHKNDANRSLLLSDFIAQLPPEFEYVSLQKELRDVDKATLQANPHIKYFGSELKDFTDTAAFCELMDIVVSVDTSVAHLSGALGRPTWILLPYVPDWRWLLDRTDSPWYSCVKLYRQEKINDWHGVLESVKGDLITALDKHSGM